MPGRPGATQAFFPASLEMSRSLRPQGLRAPALRDGSSAKAPRGRRLQQGRTSGNDQRLPKTEPVGRGR